LNPRNGTLRIIFTGLILGPAIESIRARQKGPIESAFLFISTVVGLVGFCSLEIWAYLQDKKQPRSGQAPGDHTSDDKAPSPDWMGTPGGRNRRVTMAICLIIALVGTAIVILNLTGWIS
jgi:hypothetical protein